MGFLAGWLQGDRLAAPGQTYGPLFTLRLDDARLHEHECFHCGLPKGLWTADSGAGCEFSGHAFCCEPCRDADICDCRR